MTEIVYKSDLGTLKVYECPECDDAFTANDAEPEGTNRSPCCGKMSRLLGEGLYVEDSDVVIMEANE